MKLFLWVLIVLFVIELIGKAIWLAGPVLPPRTRAGTAGDIAALACLLAWAAALVGGAA